MITECLGNRNKTQSVKNWQTRALEVFIMFWLLIPCWSQWKLLSNQVKHANKMYLSCSSSQHWRTESCQGCNNEKDDTNKMTRLVNRVPFWSSFLLRGSVHVAYHLSLSHWSRSPDTHSREARHSWYSLDVRGLST